MKKIFLTWEQCEKLTAFTYEMNEADGESVMFAQVFPYYNDCPPCADVELFTGQAAVELQAAVNEIYKKYYGEKA